MYSFEKSHFLLGNQHNFDKQRELRVSALGSNYDAESIMHYGKFAFAKDRKFDWLKMG